jgi:hypothetical protein
VGTNGMSVKGQKGDMVTASMNVRITPKRGYGAIRCYAQSKKDQSVVRMTARRITTVLNQLLR